MGCPDLFVFVAGRPDEKASNSRHSSTSSATLFGDPQYYFLFGSLELQSRFSGRLCQCSNATVENVPPPVEYNHF